MFKKAQGWFALLGGLMLTLAAPIGLLAQEATPAPAPPANPNAVLEAIPADATAFVAVRNLLELDHDIVQLTNKLNFPLAAIGFPSPLAFIKENVQLTEGIEDNRGLAVVVLNCQKLEAAGEVPTRMVVYIPCSDVDALTEQMNAEKEGDLLKVQLLGQPSVAAEKDGFLVVAQNAEALREAMQSKGGGVLSTLSETRRAAYLKHDLTLWFNPRGVSKAIRQEVVQAVTGMMTMGMPMADPEDLKDLTAESEKLAESLEEASLGLNIDEKTGVGLEGYVRFLPDSKTGQQIAGAKSTDQSLLFGLPDEAAVVYGGAFQSGRRELVEQQMRENLDRWVTQEAVGDQVDPEQLAALKNHLVNLIGGLEQWAFSFSGLPAGSQDGLIGVTVVGKVANAERCQADVRQVFTLVKEMAIEANKGDSEAEQEMVQNFKEGIQWKEDAEKLAGAAVDHFVVDLSRMPDMDEDAIAEAKGVIGQEGVLIRVAAVGDKHVVITFGGGAERFAEVVDHVNKGESPLADRKNVKLVSARMPTENRLIEGYFSVDSLLSMMMDITGQMGQMMPLPLAMKETSPIAVTVTHSEKTAVQLNLMVPVELLQATMDMVKPMMQMMMGGMGGGPGGQPGGQPEPIPLPEGELK